MTNEQIIKAAVELATGFSIDKTGVYWIAEDECMYPNEVEEYPWFLDALAAQLVRQYHQRHPNDRLVYQDDVMEVLKYVVNNY